MASATVDTFFGPSTVKKFIQPSKSYIVENSPIRYIVIHVVYVWYVLGVQTRVEIIELRHEHTDNSTVIRDNNNCNSVDYSSSDSL